MAGTAALRDSLVDTKHVGQALPADFDTWHE